MTVATTERTAAGPICLVWDYEPGALPPIRFDRAVGGLPRESVILLLGDEWPNAGARALKAALDEELRRDREAEWRRDAMRDEVSDG